MQRIYSANFRLDHKTGKGVFTLYPVIRLLLFPAICRAVLIFFAGNLLSVLTWYFYIAGIFGALLSLAMPIIYLAERSPQIKLDNHGIEFSGNMILVKDIVRLRFTKARLNRLQNLFSRLTGKERPAYQLTLQCSHQHIVLPFILTEQLAQEITWLIFETIENNRTHWASVRLSKVVPGKRTKRTPWLQNKKSLN